MTKPEWKDAPDWANYLAQEGDLCWWWYADKPRYVPEHKIWFVFGSKKMRASDPSDLECTLESKP